MKKIDLNKKEDFNVKATFVSHGKEIKDIPCKIYLPERLNERPYITLKSDKKITIDWKVEFNPINYATRKIINLGCVYLSNCKTKFQDGKVIESTAHGEPRKLCIIDNIKNDEVTNTHITFWISENNFLSPCMPCTTSYTGNIEYERINNFEFIIDDNTKLIFDENFKTKNNDNGDLVQWSYLVATMETSVIAATEVEEKILTSIDDFLLIASFISRRRTLCVGWSAYDKNCHVEFYRCDMVYPKHDEKHDINDGIVSTEYYENFVTNCYKNFSEFENKLALRNAIYGVFPSTILETSFLYLFSSLESLILAFRRENDFEHILPQGDFSKLKEHIKQSIKNFSTPEINKDKRASIYKKLDELNRVSLKEAFELFSENYNLDVSDLWGIFRNKEIAGLLDIRNKLAHGDPFPRYLFSSLIVARKHLKYILERAIVVVLGQKIEDTKLTKSYLDNFTAIHHLSNAKKEISDFLKS